MFQKIMDLANEGVIASELGIPPRRKLEINDRYEVIFKELNQIINDEVGTVGTKGLIVQCQ